MTKKKCTKCGKETNFRDYVCWKCKRVEEKDIEIDISETIYKKFINKIEIDVENDIKNLIELLTPAIINRNDTEKAISNISSFIEDKYSDFLSSYYLFAPLKKVLEQSIKQREYDKKQNDFKAKIALNVYNKQMSEPVKGLGFSIITNDFISAASYIALSAYDTNKQIKKQENLALKTLSDNLKGLNSDNSMYDSDVHNAYMAIGDIMRMINKVNDIKHFIAKHFDFYARPDKYDLSQMFYGVNLYDVVAKNISCNSFIGSCSDFGEDKDTIKTALESEGYIYLLTPDSYLTTTKYEQEVLEELYYRKHPEEKSKKDDLLKNKRIKLYSEAEKELDSGKYFEAAMLFQKAIGYKDSMYRSLDIWNKHILQRTTINFELSSACSCNDNGTVNYVNKKNDVKNWNNINQVVFCSFDVVGLTDEGVLKCTKNNIYSTDSSNCISGNGNDWKNVVQIANSNHHLIGLHSNGRVSAVGSNSDGQCNVGDWTDVVKIKAALNITMALKKDGTVLLAGKKDLCEQDYKSWRDIQDIEVSYYFALGLKKDGTVKAIGTEDYIENISTWHDVIRIKAVDYGAVGFTKQGKVLYAGKSNTAKTYLENKKNVVDVCGDQFDFWLLLHGDGTVSTRNAHYDVSSWNDVVFATGTADYACGIKRDGTVLFVGKGRHDEGCFNQINSWKLFDDINTFSRNSPELIRKNIDNNKSLIEKQISDLQKELSELRGIFVGKKKKEITKKIRELEQWLKF